ncbi:PREDICTED: pentatricopeptide repeat-containing protein At4g20770 isoform X1 [Camelina sativa]|uniref:Pentatricopeptide repeat-containing protein At4g20770 isoform X1 n=1 Tax=Camelina sativa TaxID=90675 RepID=A0ABM1QSF1_CAMSA|nr:PREDICTED: pentatricopeptide repeat-containing protein At4g20770 isoform X2 [Camelina sativa]XP_019089689.1 PREDICTED: pentatricopeptide repeat-containing protein At4g20770 isoform X1 [Camelina sativa]
MRSGGGNRYFVNLLRCYRDKRCKLSGKIIHGFIVRTGLDSDTYICNRLLDLYIECGDKDYARKVFYGMSLRDVYSWNAFLTFCCKAGDLKEACEVFDGMPERDVVSWNNMISVLVRKGFDEEALVVYGKMVCGGFLPSRFTLASVLSACGKVRGGVFGMRCHGVAVKTGLDENIFVGNALLSMYAKCGLMMDYGVRVFDSLSEANEVSFTAVISGLARENRVLEAVEMFRSMCQKGVQVDPVCLSNILSVSTPREGCEIYCNVLGKQIHSLALRFGFVGDLHLNNSLLEIYAKNKDMSGAELIFAEMPEVNVVSWNIMIAGFGQEYQSDKAIEYLKRMRDSGVEPNEVTYISVLGACFRSGVVETGRRIFCSIPHPSVRAWNAMLSGYSNYEHYEEAINSFRQMQFQNLKPDITTLSVILSSCARLRFLEGGKQIHGAAIRTMSSKNSRIVSGLIAVYSECEKIEISESVFDDCYTELDIACWNSMISGLSRNKLDTQALMLFRRMHQTGVLFPNETSYAIVLSSCSRLCSLVHGRQFHGQVVKSGYVSDSFVETALTDMYCKCGEIDSARQFFDTVSRKNTVIWNEMIHGYAHNGRGDEAVDLYREMISTGEQPDGITFVSVLTACSHSGLVDTGLEILSSMQRDHGIEPELDHYICIVDCLGRAGRLEDAETLAEATPYKSSSVLWEILLSSCRVHGDVSLARRVAEKLMRLDPQNSAAYVLLSNTYSSVRQWDDAAALQGLKNKNRVHKTPGHSWITYGNALDSTFQK